MRAFLIGLGLSISFGLALLASGARADPPSYAQTVAVCGTPNNTPVAGNPYPITMDETGSLCIAPVTVDATNITVTAPLGAQTAAASVATTVNGALPAGTNSIGSLNGFASVHVASATTTVVKSGAGVLHTLTINKPVASDTITIYDNTAGSGTAIAIPTIPSTVTGESPFTLIYDAAFATGLTVVTSGSDDITVSYR